MLRRISIFSISTLIAVGAFVFCGCSYSIKYKLNDRDIVKANTPIPMRIQVATFSDARDAIEREKSARKEQGFKDAGDYTYDKEFRGSVAEEMSKMLVSHLTYSESFLEVELSQYHSNQISDNVLEQLKTQNVDAILVGDIQHFYGYYDKKPGKQALYGLGLALAFGIPTAIATTTTENKNVGFARFEETTVNPVAISLASSLGSSLGFYIESTGKRNTEGHAKLSVKLLSTSNHHILWEDTFEIHAKEFKSLPGLNTQKRKFELAVGSLRDAVNEMVNSLESTSLITEKR